MGSTISTKKMVAAFMDSNGQPVYAMYEQTYESNCYPREPRWSARALGSLASTMRMIFDSAAVCEGGMLKGPGGRDVLPETYIAAWLKELATPVELRDSLVTVKVGDRMMDGIPQDVWEETKAKLMSLGFEAVALALDDGVEFSLSIRTDSELLCALYDGDLRIGAWRIMDTWNVPVGSLPRPELGYSPTKAKTHKMDSPKFLKLHEQFGQMLIHDQDNMWSCNGYGYDYVAQFVRDMWRDELVEPGSYRSRIKHYRAAVTDCGFIPSTGVVVVADSMVPLSRYQHGNLNRLLCNVRYEVSGTQYRFPLPANASEGTLLYNLAQLPGTCAHWEINRIQAETAPARQYANLTDQLSLLAS